MKLDIIEVKKENGKKKFAITLLIIILIFVLIFILVKNSKNNNKNTNEYVEEENIIENNIQENKTNTSQKLVENISNIYNIGEKNVYLTFDDGPSKTVTPLILDLLKEKNVKATFFVLGSRAELYPELVKRAYDEGHYIANHGYSHIYDNLYASSETIISEFETTENLIRQAIQDENYESHLIRFPGGSKGNQYSDIISQTIPILKERNIAYLDWNALTGESSGKKTKEAMWENFIWTTENKNNIVLLMHDAGDKILVYELLPQIIEYFTNNGYTFKTIYDLF